MYGGYRARAGMFVFASVVIATLVVWKMQFFGELMFQFSLWLFSPPLLAYMVHSFPVIKLELFYVGRVFIFLVVAQFVLAILGLPIWFCIKLINKVSGKNKVN